MSSTSMSISKFLTIAPKLLPRQAVLLRANHGVGKSQIARLVASMIRKELKVPYPVIDRRLSQITEGDIIGLPSTDGDVTRFCPPDWYMKACREPCFLFLDELNRATPEVMQAAFQIVLDGELNGHKLHPQSRVFSAVNSSSAYSINEIDPALLDRFWCIDLNATDEDWIAWARSKPLEDDPEHAGLDFNIAPVVTDFIASEPGKWLDPPKNYDPKDVQVSRRSWDKLSMSLSRAGLIDNPEDDNFWYMSIGFIGTEVAIKFRDFAKSVDNRITGEELLNHYNKVKPKLARLGPEKLNIAIDKLADYCIEHVKSLTPAQSKNLKEFMQTLPGELRLSCWSKLTKRGTDKIELARSVHSAVAETIMDVFGVPMGSAGIGVVPNIPGVFKRDSSEANDAEKKAKK